MELLGCERSLNLEGKGGEQEIRSSPHDLYN